MPRPNYAGVKAAADTLSDEAHLLTWSVSDNGKYHEDMVHHAFIRLAGLLGYAVTRQKETEAAA